MPIALHNAVDDDESSESIVPPHHAGGICQARPEYGHAARLEGTSRLRRPPGRRCHQCTTRPSAHVLKTVPTDRTVVVYCAQGWWSEEVAGNPCADRGYDVASPMAVFKVISTILKPTTINGPRCRSLMSVHGHICALQSVTVLLDGFLNIAG